jgi:metal-responsive CopG/Arc/MetJ family transcriptional regulator
MRKRDTSHHRDGRNIIIVPPGSPKKVVSIKLEVDIIREIDEVWKKLGYSSRSEFIREAILYYAQIAPMLHSVRNRNKGKINRLSTSLIVDEEFEDIF